MQVQNGLIRLNKEAKVHGVRPAADVLFESAAREYGPNLAAIVLTGMGSDGTQGARKIQDLGGYVVAQDEASSVVFGMPGSVIRAKMADLVIPLNDVSNLINRMG